jgi:hypothetical protein
MRTALNDYPGGCARSISGFDYADVRCDRVAYNPGMKIQSQVCLAACLSAAAAGAAPLTLPYQLTHLQNMDPSPQSGRQTARLHQLDCRQRTAVHDER